MRGIDLIWLGNTPAAPWALGSVWPAADTVAGVVRVCATVIARSDAEALLFWDSSLGSPNSRAAAATAERPGDIWHAGLRLGLGGLPEIIDFLNPVWTFNRDADAAIESTSWRLSLRCCLMRREALAQMGGTRSLFHSLDAAALEFGHRAITRGVLTRHVPNLTRGIQTAPEAIGIEDQVRFAYYRFGARNCRWALFRAVASGLFPPRAALMAWRKVAREPRPAEPEPFRHGRGDAIQQPARVSVIIPTLDRYPYLRTVLRQLGDQTVPPYEVIIADQSRGRETDLAGAFPELPLKIVYPAKAGQCTARNLALATAEGDYLLFLDDDDDEIRPDLIERHLANIHAFRAEVSSGVAEETGAGPLPEHFRYTRASDVFPTNNSLACRSALERTGLFDLAYDHRQQADGDLGNRISLAGALMVLDGGIRVLHHHAPSGGLRTHKARVNTYAASRGRLLARNLPPASVIYRCRRYFSERQVREMLWAAAAGTLSIRGGLFRKALKAAIATARMPDTCRKLRRAYDEASAMLEEFPRIPALERERVHAAE